MTLRRYTPLRQTMGTQFPREIVEAAIRLHGGCLGPKVGMPGRCSGPVEGDHIRASGALSRKSRSTLDNCAPLCRFVHHRLKTDHARDWRPRLIEAVDEAMSEGCVHVDPVFGCASCQRRSDPLQLPEPI